MKRRAELRVRAFEPGDEHAVLAAFNRAFAAADPGFVARDLDAWRWRFERNPDGARVMLALDETEAVVAQYAGLGASFQRAGERFAASQSVDSFVDPTWRGLGRSGVFVRTGLAFAERFGGTGPDRDLIMWGLPVPAARRIGSLRLGYGFVRSLLQLAGDPARLALTRTGAVEVSELNGFDDEFDALFDRLAPELGVVARRDAARLTWRYRAGPVASYRVAAARRAGRLLGYLVLARGSFDQREAQLIVDVLAERGGGALTALVAWAAECARTATPALPLVTLLPDSSPEWLALQDMGLRVEATRYTLVARSYSRRLDVSDLRAPFWLTLGDTDLV